MHSNLPGEYEELYGVEKIGGTGIGVRILINSSPKLKLTNEPNDKQEALRFAAMDAVEKVAGEIEKLLNRDNPERQAGIKRRNDALISCFPTPIRIEHIPNGYCSQACCADRPWFLITTSIGTFKVGDRKSVIHLEWTNTDCKKPARVLFMDEDVTKTDYTIHAWSIDKLAEYVRVIVNSVTEVQPNS